MHDPAALRAALAARGVVGAAAGGAPLRVLVHCAGVTRDRQLRAMTDAHWGTVEAVNWEAALAINGALGVGVGGGGGGGGGGAVSLRCPRAGRGIAISSINGIAGARGQTNYAWTKAALIGYTRALAAELRRGAGGAAANAPSAFTVAPGFIESDMTARMPWAWREAGRRSCGFMQGGLPADVAEAVAALCLPGAATASGATLRVCGGNLVGR